MEKRFYIIYKNDAENIFEDAINSKNRKIEFSKEQKELVIEMLVNIFTTIECGKNIKTVNLEKI